ncbi:MAG TPA: DUF2306 domain-containing protein [Noviherbaspirillum sp.]|nr:DUF2306 domain-containing protein [Noviherbaspirillum sp.]
MHALNKFLFRFFALGVAAYAAIGYAVLPLGALVGPEMKASFELRPAGIYMHVFASVFALALGPFQFSARLRERSRRLHRWLGRLYLGVGVLLGGLSGLYLSQYALGGIVAKLGFATLAVCWIGTGVAAYRAVRRGDIVSHRKWMVRNLALTLAAVSLRLYFPILAVAGVPFEVAYPLVAWLSWVPNLIVAERFHAVVRPVTGTGALLGRAEASRLESSPS